DQKEKGEHEDSSERPWIVDTPIRGLQWVHLQWDEPSGIEGAGFPFADGLLEVLSDQQLMVDCLVMDLGVTLDPGLLDACLSFDTALFVARPEPTAMENMYRVVRHLFARHLNRAVLDEGSRALIRSVLSGNCAAPIPLDLAHALEMRDSEIASKVYEAMSSFRFRFALNQVRLRADLELGEEIRTVAWRRLGVILDYLGHIEHDDAVWTCLRSRRP